MISSSPSYSLWRHQIHLPTKTFIHSLRPFFKCDISSSQKKFSMHELKARFRKSYNKNGKEILKKIDFVVVWQFVLAGSTERMLSIFRHPPFETRVVARRINRKFVVSISLYIYLSSQLSIYLHLSIYIYTSGARERQKRRGESEWEWREERERNSKQITE